MTRHAVEAQHILRCEGPSGASRSSVARRAGPSPRCLRACDGSVASKLAGHARRHGRRRLDRDVTEVFILAVVSALDAGLLTAAVVLMGRPRPAQHLLAYLIGGMSLSIVFGLLIVLGLHGSKLLREPDRSTRR